jgi:S1-C subfamily serine protease
MSERDQRRQAFARVRNAVVAVALQHPALARVPGVLSGPVAKQVAILGSGFLVDNRGYIATAGHVVRKLRENTKRFEGATPQILIARTGVFDSVNQTYMHRTGAEKILSAQDFTGIDIGIIQIRPLALPAGDPFVPLTFSSDPCMEGDDIALCGFPDGIRLHDSVKASFASGIVSAIHPDPGIPPRQREEIQFDAPVLGGTSGGPLFTPNTGEVIGMVIRNYSEVITPPTAIDFSFEVRNSISWALDASVVADAVRMYRLNDPQPE